MNSFELIHTEENLIHTLDKDLLKRNKDLVRFYDLILVQEGASSIAIDGRCSILHHFAKMPPKSHISQIPEIPCKQGHSGAKQGETKQ